MRTLLAEGLTIDWAEMPTYNTVMAVAAGAGLLMVAGLGRRLTAGRGRRDGRPADRDRGEGVGRLAAAGREPDGPTEEVSTGAGGRGAHRAVGAGAATAVDDLHTEAYALGFGVVGLILTLTGLHMTLTWPLAAGGFPFDNVIFGEPALAFGVLLLFAALYLWKRGATLAAAPDRTAHLSRLAGPVSVFVLGMGLACFGIAVAGVKYQLFAAPPEEPISGEFADYPMLEAVFISGLYALVGIGAVLLPLAVRRWSRGLAWVIGAVWTVAGVLFLVFGAMNFFTHIGLIVNTM